MTPTLLSAIPSGHCLTHGLLNCLTELRRGVTDVADPALPPAEATQVRSVLAVLGIA